MPPPTQISDSESRLPFNGSASSERQRLSRASAREPGARSGPSCVRYYPFHKILGKMPSTPASASVASLMPVSSVQNFVIGVLWFFLESLASNNLSRFGLGPRIPCFVPVTLTHGLYTRCDKHGVKAWLCRSHGLSFGQVLRPLILAVVLPFDDGSHGLESDHSGFVPQWQGFKVRVVVSSCIALALLPCWVSSP